MEHLDRKIVEENQGEREEGKKSQEKIKANENKK
jgi:hypothetical protein